MVFFHTIGIGGGDDDSRDIEFSGLNHSNLTRICLPPNFIVNSNSISRSTVSYCLNGLGFLPDLP